MTRHLDKTRVPSGLEELIPWAEQWGISDDEKRSSLVEQATIEQLTQLANCLQGKSDADLWKWLEGPESENLIPSEEYVAFTCLTMAIDLARVILEELQEKSE